MVHKNFLKYPACPKCNDNEKRLSIDSVSKECIILRCVLCGYKQRSGKESLREFIKKGKKEAMK